MTYRVIQWATGATGRMALRLIIEHPDLELVGLIVTNPDKAGRDAAELCGLDAPTGVLASTDAEAVLATPADCVAYLPLPSARTLGDPAHDEAIIAGLLARGLNVLTTVGYLYPKAYGADVADRLEAACNAGHSTLHGTGANPGFLAELLPLTFASMSARIDRIHVVESSSFASYPSPDVIIGMMQFGRSPDAFEGVDSAYGRWLSGLFSESIQMIADFLDVPLSGIDSELDIELATESVDIAAGHIAAGTVAAQRWRWTGVAAATGEPFVIQDAVYKTTEAVGRSWSPTGMQMHVEGAPTFTLVQPHGWLGNGLLATAAHLVNAIAPVCDALPGIHTLIDLPMLRAHGATAHLRM